MCSGSRSSVVARCRPVADQEPHPRSQPGAALVGGVRLVVGADPGRDVGVQIAAVHAGRVSVDVAREGELGELALVARDHAGEVHHLGEPDHTATPKQCVEVAGRQLAPGRLEVRGRHARRGHEPDVERNAVADVEQPVDTVGAEHVRDLVRVDHDRRRPER